MSIVNYMILAQPSMGDWTGIVIFFAIVLLVLLSVVISVAAGIVIGGRRAKKTKREIIRALLFWIGSVVGALAMWFAIYNCVEPYLVMNSASLKLYDFEMVLHFHRLLLYVVLPGSILPALLLERMKPRWGGILLMVISVFVTYLNLRECVAFGLMGWLTAIASFAWICVLPFLLGGLFYSTAGRRLRQFSVRQMLIWVAVFAAICGLFTTAMNHALRQSRAPYESTEGGVLIEPDEPDDEIWITE
jgi:hypothetical protein